MSAPGRKNPARGKNAASSPVRASPMVQQLKAVKRRTKAIKDAKKAPAKAAAKPSAAIIPEPVDSSSDIGEEEPVINDPGLSTPPPKPVPIRVSPAATLSSADMDAMMQYIKDSKLREDSMVASLQYLQEQITKQGSEKKKDKSDKKKKVEAVLALNMPTQDIPAADTPPEIAPVIEGKSDTALEYARAHITNGNAYFELNYLLRRNRHQLASTHLSFAQITTPAHMHEALLAYIMYVVIYDS